MKHAFLRPLAAASAALCLLCAAALHAQSTWTGTTGNWSNSSNWDSVPVSGAGTTLSFSSSSTAYTATNDLGTFTLSTLSIGNTIGNVTLDDGTLNFVRNGTTNPTITYASGSSGNVRLTIASAVNIDTGATLTVTGTARNGSVIVDGVISGAGGLVRSASLTGGALVLTNAGNTFSGGIKVGGGSVNIRAQGAAGTGKITIGTGAVGASLVFETADNQTLANAIDLAVSGANSNRPSITNNISGLVLNGAITGTTSQTGGGTNFRLTGTGTGTINGVIGNTAGTLNLAKESTGAWTLTAANTYNGATTVSGGTLATGATGSFGAGDVAVASGATLTLGNASSIADTAQLSFTSGATINLSFSGTEVLAGISDGSTTLASGLWDADALNARFGASVFSGDGQLSIGAIPEPATYALLLGLLAGAAAFARQYRRR